MRFHDQLKGGDIRSLGESKKVLVTINDQQSFNDLFDCLFYPDRVVAMRSIDVVEKVSHSHPEYLQSHKSELLRLIEQPQHKEFKWHLPLLVVRLRLSQAEGGRVWATLTRWALDQKESRIVRVHSIQGLFDLLNQYPGLKIDFNHTIEELRKTQIPSIKARIKKLAGNI